MLSNDYRSRSVHPLSFIGEPLCEGYGAAGGKCLFKVRFCLNVGDTRLTKKDVPVCTATDVELFEVKKPR